MPRPATPTAATWDDIWPTVGEPGLARENIPVRFHIAPRGQNWEVFRNAAFWGIFRCRHEAMGCVQTAMQQIFEAGSAAQLCFAAAKVSFGDRGKTALKTSKPCMAHVRPGDARE